MEAKRTLVKSPPELWAEVSDPGALARHLGEFGEIRITRTEPESLVVWEGEKAAGRVHLEPSGWGTRVTLTAEAAVVEPPPREPEPEPEPEPPRRGAASSPGCSGAGCPSPSRAGRRRAGTGARARAEPEPAIAEDEGVAALTTVLDTLGAAHHRPFSRP